MWVLNTCDQQFSRGGATVERQSDGHDVGVIDDSTSEAVYVTESVVSVARQKVTIAAAEMSLIAHRTNTGLPGHNCHVVLTIHIDLHVGWWARLWGQKKRQKDNKGYG